MFTITLFAAIAFLAAIWLYQRTAARRFVPVSNAELEAQLDSMIASLDAQERSYANEDRKLRRQERNAKSAPTITTPKPHKPKPPKEISITSETAPDTTSKHSSKKLEHTSPAFTPCPTNHKPPATSHAPLPSAPPRESIELARRTAWLPLCRTAINSTLTRILLPIRMIAISLWAIFSRPKPRAPSPQPSTHSIAA